MLVLAQEMVYTMYSSVNYSNMNSYYRYHEAVLL